MGPRGSSSYMAGPDDSEEEDDHSQAYPLYQSHHVPGSHTSQESLNSVNPTSQVFNMFHINIFQTSL